MAVILIILNACDITQAMENAKHILLTTRKLAVKVTPRAHTDRIDGMATDGNGTAELKLRVRAVADDGRANEAVIALIAAEFSLPKSTLSIARGTTSRHKVIAYQP